MRKEKYNDVRLGKKPAQPKMNKDKQKGDSRRESALLASKANQVISLNLFDSKGKKIKGKAKCRSKEGDETDCFLFGSL